MNVYDPALRLDFVSPVPEDEEAKLAAVTAGVDKWFTKDEARAKYGEDPLPNQLGEHIVVTGVGATTLERVIDGTNVPAASEPSASKSAPFARQKQIAARDVPGLYDDLGIDPNDLGCIMLDTKPIAVMKHVDGGEDDLVDASEPGDHVMGAVGEVEPHVTLLYGLLENGNKWKDKVDAVLDGWSMQTLKIESVGSFETSDAYAIVAHVAKTDALVDGHERLTLLPHIQTFSEYKPHITLAYVKPDVKIADKWVKALDSKLAGTRVGTLGINYGDPEPEGAKRFLISSRDGVKKKS